jgi:hypothetical protein
MGASKNPREPKAVKKLIADAQKRIPPKKPKVIPESTLWNRLRLRGKHRGQ